MCITWNLLRVYDHRHNYGHNALRAVSREFKITSQLVVMASSEKNSKRKHLMSILMDIKHQGSALTVRPGLKRADSGWQIISCQPTRALRALHEMY